MINIASLCILTTRTKYFVQQNWFDKYFVSENVRTSSEDGWCLYGVSNASDWWVDDFMDDFD
jgi:predicted molibdopterin-dependent oxidoreductase YjgC